MLFIFFDIGSPLSYLILVALVIVIIILLPLPALYSSTAFDIISIKSYVEYSVLPQYTPGRNLVNSNGDKD